MEYPLRSSVKNMELDQNSIFFLGAEFVELDLFGRKVWEQSYKRWSRAVPNRP